MKPAGLVFLRGNDAAQRLAIAWPLVENRAVAEPDLVREWARLADVPPHVAERLAIVLWRHEICRADGTVDPLAEAFVASLVQKTLPRTRK